MAVILSGTAESALKVHARIKAVGGHLILSSSAGSVVRVSASLSWSSGAVLKEAQGGSMELGDSLSAGAIPHIDYHYGVGSAQDYNVRTINAADQRFDFQFQPIGAIPLSISSSGELHNRSGHLILSSSAGSTITFSGNLKGTSGAHTLSGTLDVTGDIGAAGGYRVVLGPFIKRNQAATTKAEMNSPADGTASTDWTYWVVPSFPGSIVGISITEMVGNAVAGSPITLSASINGVANATAKLTVATGKASGSISFAKDAVTFSDVSRLGLFLCTNSAYSSTGNDYAAWLTVEM